MIGALFDPARFQGSLRRKHYFEGWYFKQVTADGRFAFAFIPGISLGNSPEESHCFVQFFDSTGQRFIYSSYDVSEFWYSKKQFEVAIGQNRFSSASVQVNLEEHGISADLSFIGLIPWPVTLFSPGAMGWYAYIPFMEDYHGVLSFTHRVEGTVQIGGRQIDVSGGKGYIEKDRGTSFPESWIWMQSNHFEEDDCSLTLSVAIIPWLGRFFTGFITGLWHKGTLYRFCTYNGSSITAFSSANLSDAGQRNIPTVSLTFENNNHLLHVTGRKIEGTRLKAPVKGIMEGHVHESLSSLVELRLFKKGRSGHTLLFEGMGRHAGVEIHGDTEKLKILRNHKA